METKVIGFAGTFYTLWSVTKEPVYVTSNNQHFLVGHDFHFNYLKNISIDIEKVKSSYPNLDIDEELRGKTQSWIKNNQEDLCPQIMKFGKYIFQCIDDLVQTDFDYIIWMCETQNNPNAKYALSLDAVKSYFSNLEKQKEDKTLKKNEFKAKLLKIGSCTFIPEKNLTIDSEGALIKTEVDGTEVFFIFPEEMFSILQYKGFHYGLPIVNGKAKKIKGKSITVHFDELVNDEHAYWASVFKVSKIDIN